MKSLRLTGAVFLEAELKAPWSFRTPPGRALADILMPEADHVVPYHLVTAGACTVRLDGGPAVGLAAGDVVIFPGGDSHVLCDASAPSRDGPDLRTFARALRRDRVMPVRAGGEGPATGLVCGFFACDRRLSAPVLEGLPRVVRAPLDERSGAQWLQSMVRFSLRESAECRLGSATLLAKASELLFVEAIRRYAEQDAASGAGWLAGLRDAHVARVLALLHSQPERRWTLESLAREAALSRSVLAERFAHFLGRPPMQYLTHWRLALAASRLRDGGESVSHVAARVGYESESAFTRAFRREFGLPPAAWRKTQGGHGAGAK